MNEEIISVIDAAKRLGRHKQTIFKIINRLGISTTKQRSSDHRNQLISYITKADLELIIRDGVAKQNDESGSESISLWQADHGVFYLIQLESEYDPGRFKVGFASNMIERLRAHRCSAPFATVLDTWACHKLWEKTAIDCVTQNCEQIHTEVFRTEDITIVRKMCDQFFSLMPPLEKKDEEPKA